MNGDEKNDYSDKEVKLDGESIQQSRRSKGVKKEETAAALRAVGNKWEKSGCRKQSSEVCIRPPTGTVRCGRCEMHVLCAPILCHSATHCQTGGPASRKRWERGCEMKTILMICQRGETVRATFVLSSATGPY